MSNLIVISYPDEAKAEEVRQKLFSMQRDYLIDIGDAVIAVKEQDGKIKLHQMFSTTAAGAASGSFWGLLVGILFMAPVLGVAAGAAAGALSGALTDFGIDDKFMKDVSANLQPGNAALFVLVRKMTDDKVFADLKGTGGTVLQTSLDDSKEQALRNALAAHIAATPAKEAVPS